MIRVRVQVGVDIDGGVEAASGRVHVRGAAARASEGTPYALRAEAAYVDAKYRAPCAYVGEVTVRIRRRMPSPPAGEGPRANGGLFARAASTPRGSPPRGGGDDSQGLEKTNGRGEDAAEFQVGARDAWIERITIWRLEQEGSVGPAEALFSTLSRTRRERKSYARPRASSLPNDGVYGRRRDALIDPGEPSSVVAIAVGSQSRYRWCASDAGNNRRRPPPSVTTSGLASGSYASVAHPSTHLLGGRAPRWLSVRGRARR